MVSIDMAIVGYAGKWLEKHDTVTPKIIQSLIMDDDDIGNETVSVAEIILVLDFMVESSYLEQISSYGLGTWRRWVPENLKEKFRKSNHRRFRGTNWDESPTPSVMTNQEKKCFTN